MPTFEFVAAGPGGQRISGRERADSERALDAELERRGLILTGAKPVDEARSAARCSLSRDELVTLTTQLATVTGAGVPIVEGLSGIGERLSTAGGKALIERMLEGLQAGESLSEVMDLFPRAFPAVYRASVRAGEASGALDSVLTRLAKFLEWTRAMRATTAQALVYPSILLLAIFGLILVLLFHVLPKLMTLFPADTTDLPWQTEVVMGASNLLRENAVLFGLGMTVLVVGSALSWRRPEFQLLLDRVLLRIPKFGSVVNKLAMSRFASTAATLHAAGCNVFTVLQVSAETCGNSVLRAAFDRAIERVRKGTAISDALAEEPQVDPLLVQMVSVGERAGALEHTLAKLAEYYDDEVPRTVKRFLSFLEPLLLLGAGGLVAFILMAAVLPLFQLYENIG